MVGYTQTGYVLYGPEENKLYESRHVRFIKRKVYRVDFGDEINESGGVLKSSDIGVDVTESDESAATVEPIKNEGRGRPRKSATNGVSCSCSPMDCVTVGSMGVISARRRSIFLGDLAYHALLAKIQGDPQTYREAVNSPEGEK